MSSPQVAPVVFNRRLAILLAISAVQIALLIPIGAGVIGLIAGLGIRRLPDPKPVGSGERMLLD